MNNLNVFLYKIGPPPPISLNPTPEDYGFDQFLSTLSELTKVTAFVGKLCVR